MAISRDERFAFFAIRLGLLPREKAEHALEWIRANRGAPSLRELCLSQKQLSLDQIQEVDLAMQASASSGRLAAIKISGVHRVPFPDQNAGDKTRIGGLCGGCGQALGSVGSFCPHCGQPRDDRTIDESEEDTQRVGVPRLRLEVTTGPMVGRVFEILVPDTCVLGRSEELKVSLPGDPSISRQHCMIEACPPDARLVDLGSRNGTYVNQDRVSQVAELTPGDLLRLSSKTALRYSLVDCESFNSDETKDMPPCTVCGGVPCVCTPDLKRPARPTEEHFPGLTVLRALGEGGVGLVYLARRVSSNELVAVKTMRPDRRVSSPAVSRFLSEATYGAQVDHPNAVRVLGSGFHEGVFYFVMEYVEGLDARRELKRRKEPFGLREAVGVIRSILGAVTVAHGRGLVHRDIKPANIILRATPDGGFFPKLADFGLMRSFTGAGLSFTDTGEGKGTPAFMPPEQLEDAKTVGPPADIYSLAATLFYMLTAQYPIDLKGNLHRLIAILEGTRIPLRSLRPDAPDWLGQVLSQCLAIRAEERPQTAAELDELLKGPW